MVCRHFGFCGGESALTIDIERRKGRLSIHCSCDTSKRLNFRQTYIRNSSRPEAFALSEGSDDVTALRRHRCAKVGLQ